MTEKQVRKGRVEYRKLIEKRDKLLHSQDCVDENNASYLYDGSFDNKLKFIFFTNEQLANIAFSDIAGATKRSNKIYAYIGTWNIRDNAGMIVGKVYGYADLENCSTKFIWSLELGNFIRNNTVIDSEYCSSLNDFVALRNRFFVELVFEQQETVVKRYKSLCRRK